MTTASDALRAQAARLLDEAAKADGREAVRALFAPDPETQFPGTIAAPTPQPDRSTTSSSVRDLFAPDPDQAFPTRTSTEENR